MTPGMSSAQVMEASLFVNYSSPYQDFSRLIKYTGRLKVNVFENRSNTWRWSLYLSHTTIWLLLRMAVDDERLRLPKSSLFSPTFRAVQILAPCGFTMTYPDLFTRKHLRLCPTFLHVLFAFQSWAEVSVAVRNCTVVFMIVKSYKATFKRNAVGWISERTVFAYHL